jgi:hypothetical protein
MMSTTSEDRAPPAGVLRKHPLKQLGRTLDKLAAEEQLSRQFGPFSVQCLA